MRTTMKMSMVNTIEQAVHPLFLISHVLGLGIYTSKPYLSTLYNVTVWSAYICLCYYSVFAFKAEKWFLATSTLINNTANLFIIITSTIISFYQHKRLQNLIRRLAIVDDTLEELGTSKMYQQLHIFVKRILILWVVCSQIANIFDMQWFSQYVKGQWCIILPYIINHIQHTNMFMNLVFTTCLWYVGTRFDKLNEHMKCLLLREEHDLRYTWKIIIVPTHRHIMCTNNYKHIFWIIMHLHLELCQLARELNAIYETQMTMEMIVCLISLTRSFRYIFINLTANDNFISSTIEWIAIYIWLFLYIARPFCLNYVCENVSTKSNEMNTIIHRLTIPLRYDIRDEIYQFTLQTIQHPLKLSGLDLFDFGNGFLRKFTIAIVTFLIIVIQMPGTSKSFMGY